MLMVTRSHFLSTLACLAFTITFQLGPAVAADSASPNAQCIECHSKTTPNIVTDWKLSKHSQSDVGCVVCHGAGHTSANDVAKVKIPTPDTCADCHADQVAQYKKGKHSIAWAAMKAMPTIH